MGSKEEVERTIGSEGLWDRRHLGQTSSSAVCIDVTLLEHERCRRRGSAPRAGPCDTKLE